MIIDYKCIGRRIKEERRRNGLTQEALAERLDVTVGYVSQIERGITRVNLETLAAISNILSCDLAPLIIETDTNNNHYRSEEFVESFEKLNVRDRQVVLGLIELLLKK